MMLPLIQTWIDDLWSRGGWVQTRDVPRIEAAFQATRLAVDRWPTLRDYTRHLGESKPQSHRPFELEWDRHSAGNRSLTAKAHITHNCARLNLRVPDWAMPESDAEADAIDRIIEANAATTCGEVVKGD